MNWTMFDTEFVKIAPTWVDEGGNPSVPPPGAKVKYTTDNPSVMLLSFDPPSGRTDLPALNGDGTEGTYVASGGLGTGSVTLTGEGATEDFAPETHQGEVQATQVRAFNSGVGSAQSETAIPAQASPLAAGGASVYVPTVAEIERLRTAIGRKNPAWTRAQLDAEVDIQTAAMGQPKGGSKLETPNSTKATAQSVERAHPKWTDAQIATEVTRLNAS